MEEAEPTWTGTVVKRDVAMEHVIAFAADDPHPVGSSGLPRRVTDTAMVLVDCVVSDGGACLRSRCAEISSLRVLCGRLCGGMENGMRCVMIVCTCSSHSICCIRLCVVCVWQGT